MTPRKTPRKTLDQMTSNDLDALHDQLDALRAVARGYCPHCGRGDAAPTVQDWEQQRDRAEFYEAAVARMRDRAEVAGVHAARAEARVRAADFTAAHWHQAALDRNDIPAAHAIACIRAALKGETRPDQLGLDDAVHEAFRAALDEPAPGPATTRTTEGEAS
jgi:hypothetical protein